jgi:hypothetical protein
MPSKTNYKDFSARIKSEYPEYAQMNDLELAQLFVRENPQYGEFVVFDEPTPQKKSPVGTTPGQPVGSQSVLSGSQEKPARTGNLLEDLKSAPPLPRDRFAFQREDSEGLEVPFAKSTFFSQGPEGTGRYMQFPQRFGFQGGEMVQPARPEIDESSLESPFVQVDSEPVFGRGAEIQPTEFRNTIEGRGALKYTGGETDAESLVGFYRNRAQEGATGSESDFAQAQILSNAQEAARAFALDDYNERYPNAPLSFDEVEQRLSDKSFIEDRDGLINS